MSRCRVYVCAYVYCKSEQIESFINYSLKWDSSESNVTKPDKSWVESSRNENESSELSSELLLFKQNTIFVDFEAHKNRSIVFFVFVFDELYLLSHVSSKNPLFH